MGLFALLNEGFVGRFKITDSEHRGKRVRDMQAF